jgi:predicted P-loop ATPase
MFNEKLSDYQYSHKDQNDLASKLSSDENLVNQELLTSTVPKETATILVPTSEKRAFNRSSYNSAICSIKTYLEQRYAFRYNTVNNKVEFASHNGRRHEETGLPIYSELTQRDFNSIYLNLSHDLPEKINKDLFRTVLDSDFVRVHNPIRDYLDRLPEFDNERDYIEELSGRLITDNQQYCSKYFKYWFVSLVGCALDPKFTNHLVLTLKGEQGVGKSTFIRNLIPPSLYPDTFYEGSFIPSNKDHELLLAMRLIINMDEFDSKTGRQVDAMKSVITREFVDIRKPYARTQEKAVRIASFTATTNREMVIDDPSGSRRMLILEVRHCNLQPYQHLDMAYAQAKHLFLNEPRPHLTRDDINEINQMNESFKKIEVEQEYLTEFFRPVRPGETREASLTATKIAEILSRKTKLNFNDQLIQKIGSIMKKCGFTPRKSNGSQYYDVIYVNRNDQNRAE